MKTQTTYTGSKYHFIYTAMLFTALFFSVNAFSQNVTSILIETAIDNVSWQNSVQTINTYTNNRLTRSETQQWNVTTGKFESFTRSEYTNNANGTINYVISQTFNSDSSSWENVSRITYTYNGTSQILTAISDIWVDPDWLPYIRISNTYDGNGYQTLTTTEIRDPLQNVLKKNSQTTFYNNPDGTVNYSITETCSSVTNLCENSIKTSFTYKLSKNWVTTIERWDGANWINSSRTTNTYDGNNYLIYSLTEKWDLSQVIPKWVNDAQSNISNINGIPKQIVSQSWDETLPVPNWKNELRTTFNYVPLAIQGFENAAVSSIFPIPSNDKITIKTNDSFEGLNYFIADQTGRLFLSGWLNQEETTIDINQLATGVYFFQIGNANTHAVKIIKN